MSPPQPRPGIMEIAAYVPGEAKAAGVERVIRLASNENPYGPSPQAIEAYQKGLAELHRYPDGASLSLREALGDLHGLDPTRIICGAGSDELLSLLVHGYVGVDDEVLYSQHGFLMYPIAARSVGARPVAVPERNLCADVDGFLTAVTERTRMVFLANPNNPTGSLLPEGEVRRLRAGLRDDIMLVIDAAYAEYVERDDYEAGAALVEEFDNVVMTRTFSKIYGLAALRLGWAYCPAEIAGVLERIRGPFNVGVPAQLAGVAAVADQAHIAESRRRNSACLKWFSERVTALGLEALPSDGNFLLVRFSGRDNSGRDNKAAEAAADYLKRRGILVRSVAAYGLPDCLRITVGSEEEMAALAAGLERFLS